MNTQHTISPLAQAFIDYLDCPCEYFAPMKEDGPIIEAYEKACSDAKAKGFVPMLVVVDETL